MSLLLTRPIGDWWELRVFRQSENDGRVYMVRVLVPEEERFDRIEAHLERQATVQDQINQTTSRVVRINVYRIAEQDDGTDIDWEEVIGERVVIDDAAYVARNQPAD